MERNNFIFSLETFFSVLHKHMKQKNRLIPTFDCSAYKITDCCVPVNRVDLYGLLYGCVLHNFTEESIEGSISFADDAVSKILQRKQKIHKEVRKKLGDPLVHQNAKKYFKDYILDYVNDENQLIEELKIWVSHCDEPSPEERIQFGRIDDHDDFISKLFLTVLKRECEYHVQRPPYSFKPPIVTLNYDPYDGCGDTMQYRLHHKHEGEESFALNVVYHWEKFLEHIMGRGTNSYIITKSECNANSLEFHLETTACQLKIMDETACEESARFFYAHRKDFREKITWKGKPLSDMVYNGLQCGKYRGYAYTDAKGQIVSYIDYKLRADKQLEIGCILTETDARKKGLASSLIQLVRTQYGMYQTLVGTYEENYPMRRLFDSLDFIEKYKVLDRGCPKDKDSPEQLTYSIYYYAPPLFSLWRYQSTLSLLEDSNTSDDHAAEE